MLLQKLIHDANEVISFWRNRMRKLWVAKIALIELGLDGCGYNTFQSNDEHIKASWSEVLNQYQRGADIVSN